MFVADCTTVFAAAETKLAKALSSVPDHARGHMYLGYVHILTRRATEGIAESEHALELDRNLASAHHFIGVGKICIGHAEETEFHFIEALRLSPRDTMAYTWMNNAGAAKLPISAIGSKAAAWFRRAVEANRNYAIAYFNLAAALAPRPMVEAHSAVMAGLALNRPFAISRARIAWMARSDDPTYLANLEPIFDGLRKAGVPEH